MTNAEEYFQMSKKLITASEQFASKLPPELRVEYEQIRHLSNEVDSELQFDGFYKGFQLGLKLAVEAIE